MLWFKIVLTVWFGLDILRDLLLDDGDGGTLVNTFLIVGTWVWL